MDISTIITFASVGLGIYILFGGKLSFDSIRTWLLSWLQTSNSSNKHAVTSELLVSQQTAETRLLGAVEIAKTFKKNSVARKCIVENIIPNLVSQTLDENNEDDEK